MSIKISTSDRKKKKIALWINKDHHDLFLGFNNLMPGINGGRAACLNKHAAFLAGLFKYVWPFVTLCIKEMSSIFEIEYITISDLICSVRNGFYWLLFFVFVGEY